MDPRTRAKVNHYDYTNSGYDRGHMAPNYGIALSHGVKAQMKTFLMSNITPQQTALNTGIWRELEMNVANNYNRRFNEIWILYVVKSVNFGRVGG